MTGPLNDTLGAFCRHAQIKLAGRAGGPLAGLNFAAKDIIEVAGATCCAGNPDWLRTHQAAAATAPAITRLLEAGATLVGKTLSDELAFAMTGENVHYGTPVNTGAPGRIPGGSSSGSASAVAGDLVDFALGTDTGGSVRVPASYCGLYGLRPTHDRIPLTGVIPLARSFDTVGLFARDAGLMARVGEVLLQSPARPWRGRRLLIADDLFAAAHPAAKALLGLVERIAESARTAPPGSDTAGPAIALEHVEIAPAMLDKWGSIFATIQRFEAWQADGPWIERVHPKLAEPIAQRFELASKVTTADDKAAREARATIAARLDSILRDALVLMPTAHWIAPLRGAGESERAANVPLTCIAGLGGLPQLSLPLAELAPEGQGPGDPNAPGGPDSAATRCPLGISILGPRGADEQMLGLALELARNL